MEVLLEYVKYSRQNVRRANCVGGPLIQVHDRKSYLNDYSEWQLKAREMTNNDAWGSSPSTMHELVVQLGESRRRAEILEVIRDRWESPDSTWRNIYKALALYEYLLLHGPEDFIQSARATSKDLLALQCLTHYQYTDSQGKDQGINVQTKAATVITLLQSEINLRRAREDAATKRARMQVRSRNNTEQISTTNMLGENMKLHHTSLLIKDDDAMTGECQASDILTSRGSQKQPENAGEEEEFEEFQSATASSQIVRNTAAASLGDEKERAPSDLLIDL